MPTTSPRRRGPRRSLLLGVLATTLTVLSLGAVPAVGLERDGVLVGEMTPELRQRIQTLVEDFRANTNDVRGSGAVPIAGISVAVVTPQRGSAEPLTTMFQSGTVSIDAGAAAVTPDTQFELGSETKAFTADLLAVLLAQGRISLDDTVAQYTKGSGVWEWPATATSPAVPITIGQLATHSSGLPDVPFNFDLPCRANPTPPSCTPAPENPRPIYTQQDLWDSVDPAVRTEQVLQWQPGTRWFYSNWGFAILGAILANIVQDTTIRETPLYQPALEGAFLQNLGMTRTNLEWPDAEVAVPYQATGGANVETKRWDNTDAFAGGGGLISNAVDMSRWVAAHLGYFAPGASDDVRTLPSTLNQVGEVTSECNPVKDAPPGQPTVECIAPRFQSGLAWQLFPAGWAGVGVPHAWKNGGTFGSSTNTVIAASAGVGVTEMFDQASTDSVATRILAELVPVERPRPILPVTGADSVGVPLLAAGGLVIAGAVLLVLRSRRRGRADIR